MFIDVMTATYTRQRKSKCFHELGNSAKRKFAGERKAFRNNFRLFMLQP
jgi:hypothetical protein